MKKNCTPLRYPGGKGKISDFIFQLLKYNGINQNYVEPFAGGAGIAINLLLSDNIQEIYLNDKDKSIYAFWHSILYNTDAFQSLIETTEITLKEFYKQKKIQNNKNASSLLELGFSTFFLNRTTHSGILKAGPIGGKTQTGLYTLNVRFNKNHLIQRIEEISKYKERIHLCNVDALVFLQQQITKLNPLNTFLYLDPPYYEKGKELYMNFYTHSDHLKLYQYVKELNYPWMVSYDNHPDILSIYKDIDKKFLYCLNYSLAAKRTATEIFFFQNNLKLPKESKNFLKPIGT